MKLDIVPDTGRILVGHPNRESAVRTKADKWGFDYVIDPYIPPDQVFLIDLKLYKDQDLPSSECLTRVPHSSIVPLTTN